MGPQRPFATLKTEDQWRRAAHDGTALVGEVVLLAWSEEARVDGTGELPLVGAGLAFDEHCRLYHSVPEAGRVERLLWAAGDSPAPLDLFAGETALALGEFQPGNPTSVLNNPLGLAVDENERLFLAEASARRILIYDLWSRRLVRQIRTQGRPIDLASTHGSVFALLESPAALLELSTRTGLHDVELPAGVTTPSRLAVTSGGEIFLLLEAATPQARVVSGKRPPLFIPGATDIEFQTPDTLVVARRPREDFRCFRIGAAATDEISPLKARHYDGRGIVRTPDGRIGFWTPHGFRHAVAARIHYRSSGQVSTFQLDSGEFQTIWGRLFLDACLPKDTRVRVHCIATDEPPDGPTLPRTPPANTITMEIGRPDLSPPMPPLSLLPKEADDFKQTLHRRETGRELPWSQMASGDMFETYEAPINTFAGRYLWITLLLEGNTLLTPRVRALRAEYPSHDLLRRIPKVYSRDEASAAFVRRYLSMFDGTLGELEAEGEARHALIDPRSTPPELLPWLASFVGLVFDERMAHAPRPDGRTVDARRTLLEEAIWLFRFRGTVPGLRRFLEIYLGVKPILIERDRVRGLGGAFLGESSALAANSVLGAGFRVGGAVGEQQAQLLTSTAEDAFATHAHRFTVLIPTMLGEEETAVVQRILDVHRPAHTLVEFCTVGAGMRVGRGLHVELTSLIGRTGGFQTVQVERAWLGRGSILGRPDAGTSPGGSRLGEDSRVG